MDFEKKLAANKTDLPNRPLNIFHMAKNQYVMVSCLFRPLKILNFCLFFGAYFWVPYAQALCREVLAQALCKTRGHPWGGADGCCCSLRGDGARLRTAPADDCHRPQHGGEGAERGTREFF